MCTGGGRPSDGTAWFTTCTLASSTKRSKNKGSGEPLSRFYCVEFQRRPGCFSTLRIGWGGAIYLHNSRVNLHGKH